MYCWCKFTCEPGKKSIHLCSDLMGNKQPSGKQQISVPDSRNVNAPRVRNPVNERDSSNSGNSATVLTDPGPQTVGGMVSGSKRASRRKSDATTPAEKLSVPTDVLAGLTAETHPVDLQRFGPGLQRAKSALPPPTVSHKLNDYMLRSKSMPVVSYRRADFNLDDEAIAEASKLQESLKVILTREPTMRALTDESLEAFLRSCDSYMYGSQKLSGAPGQERSHAGITPDDVAVSCIKGLKGSHDSSPNQDNYCYCKCEGYELYTVQDGHGPGGHFVSFRGVRSLLYLVIKSRNFPKNMKAAIAEAYEQCHADLLLHSVEQGFDVQLSGAACTLVVRKGTKIWLSHAGDSRVVVGSLKSSSILAETADHKPTLPNERKRLEQLGSEVQTFTFGADVSISRVFVKGTDYPGLCMSRSLGDQSVKEHGVVPTPDVTELDAVVGETFMVLASDGVWEFVPSKLVCSSLAKKLSTEGKDKCVARIVTESKKRWKANEGTYCDDITAMVVLF